MVSTNIPHSADTLYRYSPLLSILLNGIQWGAVAIGLVLAGFGGVEAIHAVKGAVAGVPAGLLFSAMFALPLRFVFARTRSIIISDAGVTALLLGKPWRTLAWPQVERIERIRAYTSITNSIGYQVHVVGDNVDIWMDSNIAAFDTLLADLTERAQQHQIELWSRDRGPDTYKKIKAEVTDPQERKRLIKSGVVTKVSSLVL